MISANTMLGNRYRLISVLATGGMGKIWRAWDKRHQQVVAVKVLKEELVGQQVFLSRLRAEATNASRVHHPALAAVYEYGETEGQGWIAMELVEGRPLSDLLAGGKTLPLERLARIMVQIAGGLQACHDKQIVHRDVKPSNILVSDADVAKLTDFGISLAPGREALTAAGMVMGTAQYLPPEQAVGNTATPAGDLYALGVICYEALAGKRPFTGATQVEIALAHVKQAVPPLPQSVPPAVAAMIMQMLEKDPAARPAHAGAVAQAFDYLLKGQPWPPELLAAREAPNGAAKTTQSATIGQSGHPGVVHSGGFNRAGWPATVNGTHPGMSGEQMRLPVNPGPAALSPGRSHSSRPAAVLPGSAAARLRPNRPAAAASAQSAPQNQAPQKAVPQNPAAPNQGTVDQANTLPPTFSPRHHQRHHQQRYPGSSQELRPLAAPANGVTPAQMAPTGTAPGAPTGAPTGGALGNMNTPATPATRPRNVSHVNQQYAPKQGSNTKLRVIISVAVAVFVLLSVILGLLFSRHDTVALGSLDRQPQTRTQVLQERFWQVPTEVPAVHMDTPNGVETGEE